MAGRVYGIKGHKFHHDGSLHRSLSIFTTRRVEFHETDKRLIRDSAVIASSCRSPAPRIVFNREMYGPAKTLARTESDDEQNERN